MFVLSDDIQTELKKLVEERQKAEKEYQSIVGKYTTREITVSLKTTGAIVFFSSPARFSILCN